MEFRSLEKLDLKLGEGEGDGDGTRQGDGGIHMMGFTVLGGWILKKKGMEFQSLGKLIWGGR